jgi:RNA polymerase sigma-70 factor (ECF subfamily)
MAPTPDDALMEGLIAGREEAYAALYDRYAARLLRVAWALIGRRAEAEDAVQDVFLGLVRARGSLGQVRNLRAYLFTALRHAARRRRISAGAGDFEFGETSDLVTDSAASDPRSERLERALRSLPPEQREVVALHVDGEMTFAEIAAALGLSPNTAASRYRYAIERLRQALKEG